ncbi:C4-dicarboxylate ABC transporter [Baekduia sp. Peel2402]|uniref:SLAC1 family transporter n=1 Tax=Baekduia sp. Peel2402 TaxID=3458296 RepID=UPI00403EB92C
MDTDAIALAEPPLLTPPSEWFAVAERESAARPAAAVVMPSWFAAAMGTGIVAVALELLPVRLPGAEVVAAGLWAVAAMVLLALAVAVAVVPRRRLRWRAALTDPAIAPALGVPPMAVLTVGAATLLAGRHVLGLESAVVLAGALWAVGTAGGLVAAVAVPAAMVTRHRLRLDDVSGVWLLPVVPPLVSSATGAALVAHVPAGEARLDLLIILYALFGLGLLAALPTAGLVWARLLLHGPGPAERAPAIWVVLGPLGTSITAANLLGAASVHVVTAPTAGALQAFGLVYGLPVAGFAALWLALAIGLTRHHAARDGVPFSAAWWSFVFPVGTLVTGMSELAVRTDSELLRGVALVLFVGLAAVWAVTAARALAAAGRAPAGRLRRRPA